MKFELWTDWCSWQTSMVNHLEGNKGSKGNAAQPSDDDDVTLADLLFKHPAAGCRVS